MSITNQKLYTRVLTNEAWTITEDTGIRTISMVLVSGTGSFTGGLTLGSLNSMPISLVVGASVAVSVDNVVPLDSFTIDATGGVINIIARQ